MSQKSALPPLDRREVLWETRQGAHFRADWASGFHQALVTFPVAPFFLFSGRVPLEISTNPERRPILFFPMAGHLSSYTASKVHENRM